MHERLVDALVGSIYGADTDRFSLAMVPQLAALAEGHRSLLMSARRCRRRGTSADGPLFYAPLEGMEELAAATAAAAAAAGAAVMRSAPVASVAPDGRRWRVDDEVVDVVVLATPPHVGAELVDASTPRLAEILAASACAGVAIVTLAVPALPPGVHGMERVPRAQARPTARHRRVVRLAEVGALARDGDEIVRGAPFGRDGLPVDDLDDAALVAAAVDDLGRRLGSDVQPTAVRVSRWPRAFPQYRPGHLRWLEAVDEATPAGLFLTGAGYRGIGVPACIADAERTATDVLGHLDR